MSECTLHGVTPQTISTPGSAAEVAQLLHEATADGAGVVPWGNGTRQHIGYAPNRYTLALRTKNINRVVEHTPADLVLTVEAGLTLGAIQALLADYGQWLPWDPPNATTATIGGLLATGASGPLRLGYGTPRDWMLGMQVALGDGRLIKSGSRVVKNVAGYDTHKLHLGALGTLGVIVEATFKLLPLPAHRCTLLLAFTEPGATLAALEHMRAAPLSPISLVALNDTAAQEITALRTFGQPDPQRLLVVARFAGVRAAVDRQLREAVRRGIEAGARCIELDEHTDQSLWQTLADFSAPLADESILLRVGVPPAQILSAAHTLEQVAAARGWRAAQLLYAGVGLIYARWWPSAATTAVPLIEVLSEARSALTQAGQLPPAMAFAVVEDAPAALRPALDIWGPAPETIGLMRSLKAAWDPGAVLNPGRYLL